MRNVALKVVICGVAPCNMTSAQNVVILSIEETHYAYHYITRKVIK